MGGVVEALLVGVTTVFPLLFMLLMIPVGLVDLSDQNGSYIDTSCICGDDCCDNEVLVVVDGSMVGLWSMLDNIEYSRLTASEPKPRSVYGNPRSGEESTKLPIQPQKSEKKFIKLLLLLLNETCLMNHSKKVKLTVHEGLLSG